MFVTYEFLKFERVQYGYLALQSRATADVFDCDETDTQLHSEVSFGQDSASDRKIRICL